MRAHLKTIISLQLPIRSTNSACFVSRTVAASLRRFLKGLHPDRHLLSRSVTAHQVSCSFSHRPDVIFVSWNVIGPPNGTMRSDSAVRGYGRKVCCPRGEDYAMGSREMRGHCSCSMTVMSTPGKTIICLPMVNQVVDHQSCHRIHFYLEH
jgi:hypothetical protein